MNDNVVQFFKNNECRGKSPQILTVKEVAGILGVSTSAVYNLVACNTLQAIHIGRLIRIRRQDLCDFLGLEYI